jgi:hypothetical protein
MTRKELEKFIDEEVSKLASEPLREPSKEIPVKEKPQPITPALKNEIEIDEFLFKAGMKD